MTSKQVSLRYKVEGQVLAKEARRATGARTCPRRSKRNGNMTNSNTSDGPNHAPQSGVILSAEKKFQIYLEAQGKDQPVGEILRREGLFSTDLARIRQQVKEGALQRLSAKPGSNRTPWTPKPTTPSSTNSRRRSGPWRICRSNWRSCEKKRLGVRGSDSRAMD